MDLPDTEIIVQRDLEAGNHKLSLFKDIYVERGTLDDWKLLSELHYKSANLGIGPRYSRCVLDGQTIGVIVFTVPKPLDSGRNQVFPHMCPNQGGRDNRMINQMRMKWLNKNMILCSRNVLDTMYRGAGIAYRFRNLAFRQMGFRYVEARSSMSRYNPFYIKAGMQCVRPKHASALESGLKFFGRNFVSPAYDYVAMMAELKALPDAIREKVLHELRAFYYQHSSMEKSGDNRLNGTNRVEQMEIGYLLKQTQQLVFGSTIYAVWVNPDVGVAMPDRIPLSAFDLQLPTEPLRLDLLKELK